MKRLLIASLAIASTSVFSQNQSSFDGFLSAGVGKNKITAYNDSDSSNMSTLRGSFSFTHSTGFGVQIDNVINNQEIDNSYLKVRTNDLALHGFYRQDNYLVGVIHQTRNFKAEIEGHSITIPLDRTFTGFEGQYDFGNLTVYGLTARDEINIPIFSSSANITGRKNTAEARYFFNDNLRTDLSYSTSKFSGESSEINTTTIGVEYKFSSAPFSAYAKFQDMNGSFVDTKRFIVGVTFNFGKETLKARNSSGVSLNPISLDNQMLEIFEIFEIFGD